MRRLLLAVTLVACTPARAPAPEANAPEKHGAETTPTESCPNGLVSLFLRDDTTHCVWRCDPEDDEPCPQDFACVGVGRTSGDALARYCETLKGPGISDGISYPSEWRPKLRAK